MIPKECKRLAEVDFPIAAVSRHAVREKSIRHGHPSTLHLWWARRPLASSRAMLMALLLPDPCDPKCPDSFKEEARGILLSMPGRPQGWTRQVDADEGLRRVILRFVGDFANWDVAANRNYLDTSRALVKAAHGDESPLVVDPFAGGGAIPLEALRVGCDAFASDLNPVACLILKVMLEDIPRSGVELAKELRTKGKAIEAQAREALADLYPMDSDGATPIAYLWARTIRCESPNCGAEVPLMLSRWLCNKEKRKIALRPSVVPNQAGTPEVKLEIFEPESAEEVGPGTVSRAKATCLCCGTVMRPDRVRAQLSAQNGGADVAFDVDGNRIGGARLMAIVTSQRGVQGREYRAPTDADYEAIRKARSRLSDLLEEWERDGRQQPFPIPEEPTPKGGGTGAGRAFSVRRYGMLRWGDLFSTRQKVLLLTMRALTTAAKDGHSALALTLTRMANAGASLCRWDRSRESHQAVYSRQALPLVWDFSEANPFSGSTGGYAGAVKWAARVVEEWPGSESGQVEQADATEHPLPDESASVWFTDPPYYDAVPYADLSDFFVVWLKRALPGNPLLRDPFEPENALSPKTREAVQDETKRDGDEPKDRKWFEGKMANAFEEGRRVLNEDGIGSVVFAHSTTEGWEALLSGMTRGGWTITGSWPIATEMRSRLRARDSAALATSVHLVCRPRPVDAPVGDWADVLRELPVRVGEWMERLQEEGIRGADLVFACVGPALEIFSRYSRVETAEGDEVGLPAYLERVWEVVGRTALENVLGTAEARARNGQVGVLEEDARLTALFLWTFESTETADENGKQADEETAAAKAKKGFALPFDVVRRFAQPMGINLDTWTDRVIAQEKGVVKLLPIMQRGKELFGEKGASAAADWIENEPGGATQLTLFPQTQPATPARGNRRRRKSIIEEDAELQTINATTLDRVHAAMLLQASGHANALRTLIVAEQDRGPDFLRLANSLSALYPVGSEEKRLLDAMLLAAPG